MQLKTQSVAAAERIIRPVPLVKVALSFQGTVYALSCGPKGSRQFRLSHDSTTYTVTIADHHDGTRDTCDCPDATRRGALCKHVQALRGVFLTRIFETLAPLEEEEENEK